MRTQYAQSGEIDPFLLAKIGILGEKADIGTVTIERIFQFQKTDYTPPTDNQFREMMEYSKAVWFLPYEIASPHLEEQIEKIKIQRVINLVQQAIKFATEFHRPFHQSPLTHQGVKTRIIEALVKSPVSLKSESTKLIDPLVIKIKKIEDVGCGDNVFLFNRVLQIIQEEVGSLTTVTESGVKVKQFLDKTLCEVADPVL